MYEIETINYRGHDIHVSIDEMTFDPSEEERLIKYALYHREYTLADDFGIDIDDYTSWEGVLEAIKEKYADIVWLERVDIFDHSGISLHLSGYSGPDAYWDSGQVGFAFLTRSDILATYNRKKLSKKLLARAIKSAKIEFKQYDDYVRGEVYQYYVEDIDVGCGGWFGSDYEYMLEDARGEIDAYIKEKQKKHFKRLKALIKEGMSTINYRSQLKEGA